MGVQQVDDFAAPEELRQLAVRAGRGELQQFRVT